MFVRVFDGAAVYLPLSVLAQRVPEVGSRPILRHFQSASPGVDAVDPRRRHPGGVRPAVCVRRPCCV